MTTAAVSTPVTTKVLPSAEGTASRWSLDAAHSHVSFSVRHMMISNVRGEFSKMSGQVTYVPGQPERSEIRVAIDVASISTREDKRDAHLRSADFFDVENHPQMTFASKLVRRRGEGLEVVGDLTIRGTSRDVVLSVEDVTPMHNDPWGKVRVGASARGRIRRSDFGMRWNAALEAGGVLVSDDVVIALEIELVKED